LAGWAYVYVDKLRLRVVADSAFVEGEGHFAEVFGGDAWDADVDGLGLHMLAVFGDSLGVGAEVVVAPRGAVAADDVDDGVGTVQPGEKIVEEVELAGIVVADVSGAVVAEEVVEQFDGRGDVLVTDAIDDVDRFAGVQVVHLQAVLTGGRWRRGGECGGAGEGAGQGGEADF